MALGSRLRRLSEMITEEAGDVYRLYDVNLQPKWFPVFYALSEGGPRTITEIAQEIGHSHPSVSKIVQEMAQQGLVKEKKGKDDGRKNFVTLSPQGQQVQEKIQAQYNDVNAAVEKALEETQHNLWKALEEWEFLLAEKSLLRRVQEARRTREGNRVTIVDYTPAHQQAFRLLNEQWITTYFKMEETDYKSLDHPQEYILDKGGHILIALYDDTAVGACALIPMDATTFELAKMAVAPEMQGRHIGWTLGQAAFEKARALGATKLYLESNTILKPAIHLYHKLGFKKVTGLPSPYERCNIQMEAIL
ncbi:GNAT family N-acetyltransferase [Fulvivirgaceae bacterium PWU37]|uniref:GNAT family N-acetyltransferase n=2 Tax=Dawidia soli TaxID=2782352 RepID=A0AAP2D6N4_9BACT|nr:GNAT family N-acetyltransferase [Dawidia soli]